LSRGAPREVRGRRKSCNCPQKRVARKQGGAQTTHNGRGREEEWGGRTGRGRKQRGADGVSRGEGVGE
ncbi:Uncharacterized protein DAT39_011372, partial [Clarias magur]